MSDARKNRGNGNGKGENWYNAELWKNIEKSKKTKKDENGDEKGIK